MEHVGLDLVLAAHPVPDTDLVHLPVKKVDPGGKAPEPHLHRRVQREGSSRATGHQVTVHIKPYRAACALARGGHVMPEAISDVATANSGVSGPADAKEQLACAHRQAEVPRYASHRSGWRSAGFGLSVGAGQLLFGVGGTADTTIRSSDIADGLWHHVAATRERTSGAIRLYVDGNLVASGTGGTLALDSPVQMRLGSLATGINFFNGQMDEVRIWNRVRGQDEIQSDMLHPLTGSESSLASYWPLDEGAGSTTRDASRFGNTGILVNGPTWQASSVAAPVAYPRIEANWGAPGEVRLSCNAVPGAGLRVLTATRMTGTWQQLPGYPPIRATNDIMVQAIAIQPEVNFFQSELDHGVCDYEHHGFGQ